MAIQKFSRSRSSEQSASRDFRRQLLEGYGLTTAQILYRLPDHPSLLAGLEVETEAIWNHLDFINLNVHVAPPWKPHR